MRMFSCLLLWAFAALVLPPTAPGQAAPTAALPRAVPESPLFFTGDALPVPPQQSAQWSPPAPSAALPEKFIAAARELFAQGLADPRGGEYRQVEVVTGSVWGSVTVEPVHAWVLPAAPGVAQRFAVGLNGLVYPVLKIGPPVDLHAEVRAIIADDRARLEKSHQDNPKSPYSRRMQAVAEHEGLTLKGRHSDTGWEMFPIPGCLLMRLGETELAGEWWQEWAAGLPPGTENNYILADPYGQLASDWAWAQFNRTVCTHMRGDDRLALLTARQLTGLRPVIEAAARAHGWGPRPDGTANGVAALYYFLGPLPELLADQERRATAPRIRPAILPEDQAQSSLVFMDDPLAANPWLAGLRARLPDPGQRIAALINNLEEVGTRQWGQPGGLAWGDDPVMQALVAEGPAAVGPLLECLENDSRLTRSVGFGRDFHFRRHLASVSEAARMALDQIFKTREAGSKFDNAAPPPSPEETRRQLAALYRTHWEKTKNLGEAERWFATLADDQATVQQWLEAAESIVQPVGLRPITPLPGAAMRGESLRAKTGPSVTELLFRRIHALNQKADSFNDSLKTDLAKVLAQWEPATDLLALEKQMDAPQDRTVEQQNEDRLHFYQMLRRMNAPGWQEKWAAWVRQLTPLDLYPASMPKVFAPFWEQPDHPAFHAAVDWLFNAPSSPWWSLLDTADYEHATSGLLGTPLLRLPAFQRHVLRNLADDGVIATISIWRNGFGGAQISFERVDPARSNAAEWDDPPQPAPGTKVAMRTKDFYADKIGGMVEGAPAFFPYWTRARRDEAITTLSQFIRRFGPNLGSNEEDRWSRENNSQWGEVKLGFPRAVHPGTPEEEAGGRTIFSLPAGARLVPIKPFPLRVRWTKLNVEVDVLFPPETATAKEGLVWQAEEVLEDGRWRRYYGFVGQHVVARVPVEEIEILDLPER